MTIQTSKSLSEADLSRLIEMAWEDRTPFDAIEQNFGLSEPQVIAVMRSELKRSSFNLWRKRVTGRSTKHLALRSKLVTRAYCTTQYKHKS
ncbi:MAG: TIGR03643 family protein [Polynucleobacter sp.]|uniref:TIGR03643 family protein n=1 Tax=Polynucleobacter sp. TaxID=2029855 RepID=UPI0027227EC3|nr:TIGR03643 family protein [Polynucleobacter sp.]MDO8713838.1 TIGR03643 family protein [Polynucleobacter sp.]